MGRKKSNFLVEKSCLHCKKMFLAETREIARGRSVYCSRSCAQRNKINTMARPTPNVKCSYCGVEFYKQNSNLKNSKSGLYFCCRSHKDLGQKIGGFKEIMPPHYGNGRVDNSNYYRRIAFSDKAKKCERCGYDDNENAILVHHKDRNRLNASKENLEILCYNCHTIEHFDESHCGHGKQEISYEI